MTTGGSIDDARATFAGAPFSVGDARRDLPPQIVAITGLALETRRVERCRGDGSLAARLRYALAVSSFTRHHVRARPRSQMEKLTWLGEGPYRVWQNRLRGTTLGVHSIARTISSPASRGLPEFRVTSRACVGRDSTRRRPTDGYEQLAGNFSPRRHAAHHTLDHDGRISGGDLSFLRAIPPIARRTSRSSKPARRASPSRRGSLRGDAGVSFPVS